MATKKQKREAAETRRAEYMAKLKASNLMVLQASHKTTKTQEELDKIAYRRKVEDYWVERIVEGMISGSEVMPGYGWTKKQLERLKERARPIYYSRVAFAQEMGAESHSTVCSCVNCMAMAA